MTKHLQARLLIGLATLIGGGSLLLLGLFFLLGSWQVFDMGLSPFAVLVWDCLLCIVFCLQHSIMIRRGFRQRLEAFLSPAYHGLFFAWTSGFTLLIMLGFWQTSSVMIWSIDGPMSWMLRGFFGLAALGFLWGTRALESMDAFGQKSLLSHMQGKQPISSILRVRGPYLWVRHPLYFFVLILMWACPHCPADRLLLNLIWTLWIIVGSIAEERDLVAEFGEPYRDYQKRVPMLVPRAPKR